MATIVNMYRRIFPFKREQSEAQLTSSQTMKESTFARILSPFESYVVSVQSILIWEKPYISLLVNLLVNLIFWLIVSYSHQFYSVLAIGGLLTFIYRTWVYQVWPEIRVPPTEEEDSEEWTPVNPQVLSVPELSRYLSKTVSTAKYWFEWLKQLRQEQPGSFCVLMTSILSIIAVIGHYISGVILAYILVMSIMIGPGVIIHVLPKDTPVWFSSFKTIFQFPVADPGIKRRDIDSELDEFLPEPTSEVMEALNAPMDNSELDLDQDDETNQMVRELGMGDLISDELDMMPSQTGLDNLSLTLTYRSEDFDSPEFDFVVNSPRELVSQSSNQEQEIRFVPSHFKDSDTDDEEDRFAEGLQFPEADDTSSMNSGAGFGLSQSVMAALSTVPQLSAVGQTLASVLSASTPPSAFGHESPQRTSSLKRQQSDASDTDLTDFEIVSAAELTTSMEDEN